MRKVLAAVLAAVIGICASAQEGEEGEIRSFGVGFMRLRLDIDSDSEDVEWERADVYGFTLCF